ncbi:MAG: NRDE family protein [Rhodospirillaceae bacterium]
MCTVVILRRPGHDWPVLLGANRDEMSGRPWRAPGRHWPDRPDLVGGLDILAGGSWLGLNDSGLVVAVLNRHGTLGPAADRRSRGELVLEALDHADAETAAESLGYLDGRAYRPFNLVVADDRDAFCLYHRDESGRDSIVAVPIPSGLSLITAFDRNDRADSRIRGALPRFERAVVPDPDRDDWRDWQGLLASRDAADDTDPRSALCFALAGGFGTSSSALLALPSRGLETQRRSVWLFAPGPPDSSTWYPVSLD